MGVKILDALWKVRPQADSYSANAAGTKLSDCPREELACERTRRAPNVIPRSGRSGAFGCDQFDALWKVRPQADSYRGNAAGTEPSDCPR